MLRICCLLLAGAAAQDYAGEFKKFQDKYGKFYNGDQEQAERFAIFKGNYDLVQETNAKQLGYTLAVNFFADMTADEVAASYTGLKPKNLAEMWGDVPHLGTHEYSGAPLAGSVDWTTQGAVTDVKNQGSCGSCWSFSTTGALEGAWKLAGNALTPLSEQQFVDCDHVDQGCGGGLMDNAFKFAENNAICTEDSYKYKGRKGTCQESSCTVGIPKGDVKGFQDVTPDNENALMEAVMKQPVSIAIEADKSAFQLYHGGILSATCGTALDHGVLLVGYGTDNGQDYWKVKNSWGPGWGDHGYIRLARGKGSKGECGILSQPSYPVVSGSGPAPGPAPGPSPPPSPPTPASNHYEKPPCQSDEIAAEVQGAGGSVCAPKCDASGSCPTDVPTGTAAKPQCILQDSASGNKYCALHCVFSGCPSGAKCAMIGGLAGVCVYPDDGKQVAKTLVWDPKEEITV